MAVSTLAPPSASVTAHASHHSAFVRITHWITALCFLALLITGVEILLSHPRFYWGESGNVLDAPLFKLPLPASRASVPTGYRYVLADQNGWSRSLHFEAAWASVFTGLLYVAYGLLTGHFRRNLLPSRDEVFLPDLRSVTVRLPSYNLLQRLTYLSVIFLLFPAVIWTGLAMSPAIASASPSLVTVLGGQQSARTLHFFVSVLLVLFVIVHIAMVTRAGFQNRMREMITGAPATGKDQA